MGIDIHIKVVSHEKIILDNMFDGRNYSWFSKIQNESDEYAFLDWQYSAQDGFFPDGVSPAELDGKGYYGFKYVSVPSLLEWFDTYKPDITAGWVRKIDAWKYRKKNMPIYEDSVYRYLEDGSITQDWEFMELPAPDDFMDYIVRMIREKVPAELIETSYLVIYFDC